MGSDNRHRTKRYKKISVAAVFVSIISFVAIMLRWRGRINAWESLYVFPASVGVGMLNSSQFTALAVSVEKPQLATAVSIFYLSQQIGLMIGASVSTAVLRHGFRAALNKRLGGFLDADKVSTCHVWLNFRFDDLVLRAKLPGHADDNDAPTRLSKAYSTTLILHFISLLKCKPLHF